MPETYFPNSEQFDVMNVKLDSIAAAIASGGDWSGAAGMQRAVRAGLAPRLFPVGSQFTVTHTTLGNLVVEVLAHDYLKSAYDMNAHTMLCRFKTLFDGISADGVEAFYTAAEAAIPAGTYHFTLSETYGAWVAGTYQFTLTNDLPKGGQLGLDTAGNARALTNYQVCAYASPQTTSPTETVAITVGSEGTDLGEFANGLNAPPRVANGSSNWKESAIRQYLNSSAAAGSVWTPQTKFDRPPLWVSTLAGFLNGFDSGWLATVGEVTVPNVTNTTYEAPDSTTPKNTAYTTRDRFFLLSQCEVFGTKVIAADQSKLLPYFANATAADLIGYLSNGTASDQNLRSPSISPASTFVSITATGVRSTRGARHEVAYAPAFCIV